MDREKLLKMIAFGAAGFVAYRLMFQQAKASPSSNQQKAITSQPSFYDEFNIPVPEYLKPQEKRGSPAADDNGGSYKTDFMTPLLPSVTPEGKPVENAKTPNRDPNLPRGIRNNNPGNIELGDNWQGLSDTQTDPRFAQFDNAIYGIRALARVLMNYQRRYGINTINGVINRWAPGTENDTAAYINAVSRATGISPDAPIDLENTATLQRIIPAIIKHENGVQPYSVAKIREGIALA